MKAELIGSYKEALKKLVTFGTWKKTPQGKWYSSRDPDALKKRVVEIKEEIDRLYNT